jgi:hypothetical protein
MKLTLNIDAASEVLFVRVSDIPKKLAQQAISVEDACGAYDGLETLIGDELRANTACLYDGSHMGPVIEYGGSVYYTQSAGFESITQRIVTEGYYPFNYWKQEDHE